MKRTTGRRRSSLARATFVTGYEVDVEAVAAAMLRDVDVLVMTLAPGVAVGPTVSATAKVWLCPTARLFTVQVPLAAFGGA